MLLRFAPMSEPTQARIVNQRLLRVDGARKGILRVPGTLVLTQQQMLFVPDEEPTSAALERVCGAGDDEDFAGAIGELVSQVAAHVHGVDVPRFHPALQPPDADGRIHLLQVGEEDDILLPVGDGPLVQLMLGPGRIEAPYSPSSPFGHPAPAMAPGTYPGTAPRMAALGAPPGSMPAPANPWGAMTPGYGYDRPGGWIGPASAITATLLAVVVLPVVSLGCIFIGDEIDDDLGAMLFLVAGGATFIALLGSVAGAVASFVRRERNRWWGLVSPIMWMLASVLILVGSMIALDELF